jgi:hypothetical protein
MRRRRLRWAALMVLASAAAVSGCYWDPYTGYVYPYPYPPPPYGAPPYPYGAPPPYPTGGPPPANGPVQQTPLPPPQ